jgi:hypothetical protein
MKHILKKRSIAGAGKGGNDPKPPVYKPPDLGELQYGASHSFAETIDLLSDGPIEGLVDRDGRVVDGLNLLQGIYFDDTPVAVRNRPTQRTLNDQELEAAEILNCQLSSGNGTGIKNCQKFFSELKKADLRSDGAKVSTLPRTVGPAGGFNNPFEAESWPACALYFLRLYRDFSGQGHGTGISAVRGWQDGHDFYLRAFIKNRDSPEETFPWFLNGSNVTNYGTSDANALYQGGREIGESWYRKNYHDSVFWCDDAQTSVAKLMCCLYDDSEDLQIRTGGGHGPVNIERGKFFNEAVNVLQEFVDGEIFKIYDLWEANQAGAGDVEAGVANNTMQATLAAKCLASLGWVGGAPIDLLKTHLEAQFRNRETCLFVAVKVNETSNSDINLNLALGEDGQILENMVTRPYGTENTWGLKQALENEGVEFYDFTCPTIDPNGVLQQDMHGFLLMKVPLEGKEVKKRFSDGIAGEAPQEVGRPYANEVGAWGRVWGVPRETYRLLADIESFRYSKTLIPEKYTSQFGLAALKFNFSNVFAEFRNGEEYQDPLNYFRTVFIDHPYNRELFGPFNADRQADGNYSRPEVKGFQQYAPQRLAMNAGMLTRSEVLERNADNYNLEVKIDGLPVKEGSDDERIDNESSISNYSQWAKKSLRTLNEQAVPVVHTVYNPNVKRAFITINVSSLNDTLTYKHTPDAANDPQDIASKFPAVLNIQVETGSLGLNSDGTEGVQIPFRTYTYRIVALIEGSTLIDIGNPDYRGDSAREFVISLDSQDVTGTPEDSYLNAGFELPPTIANKQVLLSADGEHGIEAGVIDQDSNEKRYVKITKLSFETNSVLINKSVNLNKVTEIIDVPIPYPFSAIVGTKIDSRSFSAIPRRTYDCKLKKVRVPSNYFPLDKTGLDKRYYNSVAAFQNTDKKNRRVYEGDWDGTFKNDLQWTDNPAWILYDLLTNQRYGMGSHLAQSDINIWELYKIGRFCDAVDNEGYFQGVTDGRGGKEPRFSCNVVFDQGQKLFDVINTITALFRGRIFYSDRAINFVDDRPRDPINIFTNESVKEGRFFYSNNRRDEQFNVIEVGYRDRFDNFSPKIEVVEDEENIKEKGIFKKRIEGVGITSRAMARRVAQHQIFSKIKENQQVAFTAGLESLLCKPGDLIFVEDELKTNKANFGKVLAVDIAKETIRVSNTFVATDMNPVVSIMNPTGDDSINDLMTGYGLLRRTRYSELTVTGSSASVPWAKYTGVYGFSGYTEGYPEASGVADAAADPRFQNYALYTGLPDSGTMLYFNTGVTGWVFASGTGAGNSGAFALSSGDFISLLTGDQTLSRVGTGKLAEFDFTYSDRRSTSTSEHYGFSGFDPDAFVGPTRGAFVTDIDKMSPDQVTVLNVDTILKTPSELTLAGFSDYGSVLSGFDRPDVLPFVKLGSPVKMEIKDANPFIYKVISMKEENANEYLVTATKYDTGKYALIEDNISIEEAANTFSYQTSQTIKGITYVTLNAPVINSVITGIPDAANDTFSISGDWSAVANSSGYNVQLVWPNGVGIEESVATTGHEFKGLDQVGVYNYKVGALGNNAKADGANAYFDSQYDASGIFVVYDDVLTFNRSFVNQIQIG